MATTNNIGLYCFSTGEEDAKTSLEALFGAGNSNMKKIDDAIGELRKKSFIVNTEEELNALLTEENLGKTVSYNGALYVITEGGSSNAPIAVGDTIDTLYFNTSLSDEEMLANLTSLTSYVDGETHPLEIGNNFTLTIFNMTEITGGETNGYIMLDTRGRTVFYASEAMSDMGAVKGWQNLDENGAYALGEASAAVTEVYDQEALMAFVSKEPFSSGGGIIAKPVGAEGGGLPSFAPEDAGKFLRVDSNGNIVAEAIAYAEGESF